MQPVLSNGSVSRDHAENTASIVKEAYLPHLLQNNGRSPDHIENSLSIVEAFFRGNIFTELPSNWSIRHNILSIFLLS
jgi:hypothetical protein